MGLTVIFGSRGRPDDLVKTLHESIKTLTRTDTKILVALDEDDGPSLAAVRRFPDDRG
jgi:hypothetical protein